MAGPLLETKLHVPRPRNGLVARTRLSERLSRGAESTLTLVSAPAGFGKTTLLTEWLAAAAAGGRTVAWLSLDQRDNDPTVYWSYLVTALRTAGPGVGTGALALLQPPQAPIDAVLATLLNDLHAVSTDVVLVLDDYHVIDSREVHEGMAFLLENLPAQVHLVIASRTDPTLPLPRLRARGELVEIRAADLRFTAEEAAAYLNEGMGLALTAQDVAALEERTEGWIAALQLAALSMQGRDDVAAFIASFAGDDRYIVDYLAEEVLHRQPEPVQQFLLQTSILERLTGPLCDAVTGQNGGRATLTALERGNLFLVPLDDRRHWYRYHHLFADVLRAHLLDEQPDVVAVLHRRASDWYAANGEPAEAIRHALDAHDFERAADLVERAIPVMRRTREESAVLGWLRELPDEVVRGRAVLAVGFAGAMLAVGEIEGVDERLVDAERGLDAGAEIPERSDPTPAEILDDEELRRLPAVIELYRAALGLTRGDGLSTVAHARRAFELSPPDDHLSRAGAAGLLGLAYWAGGDLEAAHRSYSECVEGLLQAGHTADTLGCAIALADIRRTQGRLGEAMRTYELALARNDGLGDSVLRGTADIYVGMSGLLLERGDHPAATQALVRSQEVGEHNGLPQNRYRSRVAAARIRAADGDLDGALHLLDEAERVYVSDFFPNVRPIPAMKARVQVARRQLGEALGWAREQRLSVEDELSYLREYEHITLARVLLAGSAEAGSRPTAIPEVTRFLERLESAAQEGARAGSLIEILVLLSLSHQSAGDSASAFATLERALTLAEPEGYVRVFADEGAPMAALLKGFAKQGTARDYVRRLQAADLAPEQRQAGKAAQQGLIEPLSERELDVLRLLGTDLDGPDIARELFVSLSTVRTHTQKIYAKLGVNSRRSAIRVAEELNLLSRTADR